MTHIWVSYILGGSCPFLLLFISYSHPGHHSTGCTGAEVTGYDAMTCSHHHHFLASHNDMVMHDIAFSFWFASHSLDQPLLLCSQVLQQLGLSCGSQAESNWWLGPCQEDFKGQRWPGPSLLSFAWGANYFWLWAAVWSNHLGSWVSAERGVLHT